MRLLLCSLLASSLPFNWDTFFFFFFFFFSFISTCLIVSASNIPKYLLVSFSLNVLILPWCSSSILFVICHFPIFIICMSNFLMPNSISISSLYILTAGIRVSNSFFIFDKQFDIVHVHWVVNLFLWFMKFIVPLRISLSMWLSGIIAITNSNGATTSPWNIYLWIFTWANVLPPAVNFTLLFFMISSMNFMTSCDILYILRQSIIQFCRTISYAFLLSIHGLSTFCVSFYSPWICVDQCIANLQFLLFPCGIFSILWGTVRDSLANSKSPS